jgi:hypothetical protein
MDLCLVGSEMCIRDSIYIYIYTYKHDFHELLKSYKKK